MEKGNAMAASARARLFVDQWNALLAARGEGDVEVGHAITDMVETRAAPGDKAADGRIGRLRFEQLHLGVAEVEMHDAGAIGEFGTTTGDVQDIAIEGQGGVKIGDGNAQMGNGR